MTSSSGPKSTGLKSKKGRQVSTWDSWIALLHHNVRGIQFVNPLFFLARSNPLFYFVRLYRGQSTACQKGKDWDWGF